MKLTAEILLQAYANGYFPMAESRESTELMWFSPEMRGIIPLDGFHVPAKLDKLVKKKPFTITTDKAFPDVIRACAERDEDTWINDDIIRLYCELAEKGFAHSVECWEEETRPAGRTALSAAPCESQQARSGGNLKLVGGLYGVALGGAFFGESMFSRVPNASKVALVHLVRILQDAGYTLLDTQYVNEHLIQFKVIEIPRENYLQRLKKALTLKPVWPIIN